MSGAADGAEITNGELARSVARIETSLQQVMVELKAQGQVYATKEHVAEVKDTLGREIRDLKLDVAGKAEKEHVDRIDNRLRAVEVRVWAASGAAAIVGSSLGAFVASLLGH